ncbi:hypothetical protein MRB53_022061 [Persea americana]|uniref:Uncharacterized protein n=1 Tax=Persea americana TaxID=3435 RepID=A0ACC2L6R4_PERAE|nr:hypothetical protein MRB53_022061 [Persea americana]
MDLEASTTKRRDTDANSIPSKKRAWNTKATQVTMTNYKERLRAKPTTRPLSGFVVPNPNPTNETAIPENEDSLIVYRIKEDGSLSIEKMKEEDESNEPSKMSTSNGPGPGPEDAVEGLREASFSCMVSYHSESLPISSVSRTNVTLNSFTFPLQMTRR